MEAYLRSPEGILTVVTMFSDCVSLVTFGTYPYVASNSKIVVDRFKDIVSSYLKKGYIEVNKDELDC